ncbi:hypothetical protein AKG98_1959 [Moritella sp. JT01]|uniref:hypothetical protein n=1 Tax=Moritella sp. JT01 TaxID=756698 RepID=UPI00079B4B1C|nr:hypothetical protein [Moritella sp. JT01]KXO08360.1 hypothetical protein AKG98_1959 [Moritella sp. JT01]
MSYKLILLSDLTPTDLKMVLRPHVAVDIIRELHLYHTQIWDLDWHNAHADFMTLPEDKYARVIDKLLLGHIVLLQWPRAQFDGVIDHRGNVNLSMTMGIGNEVLVSKVRTLQATTTKQESHSLAAESKPLSKPIITPVNSPDVASSRTIKGAAAQQPVLLEFKLLDHDDVPMANAAYLVTLASGDEVNGQLDTDGYVKLCGVEYKNAKICFPEFDSGDWS